MTQCTSFSDLLLHIPNSNLSEGNLSLTDDLQPFFDQAEVSTVGNPRTVSSPTGYGISLNTNDQVRYKFPISHPYPCPFYIKQCPTGFTPSFWFRWESLIQDKYRYYISLGNKVFYVYKSSNNALQMRWNVDAEFSWYSGALYRIGFGKWYLITWRLDHGQCVLYVNGLRFATKIKENINNLRDMSNELYINPHRNNGNFSVGPMQWWAGRKSPVFIWRLFQDGLPDYDGNWTLFIVGHSI